MNRNFSSMKITFTSLSNVKYLLSLLSLLGPLTNCWCARVAHGWASTNYLIQWVWGDDKDWCVFEWCVGFAASPYGWWNFRVKWSIGIETFKWISYRTNASSCLEERKKEKSLRHNKKKSLSFKPLPSSFVLHDTSLNCLETTQLYVLKLQKRVFHFISFHQWFNDVCRWCHSKNLIWPETLVFVVVSFQSFSLFFGFCQSILSLKSKLHTFNFITFCFFWLKFHLKEKLSWS